MKATVEKNSLVLLIVVIVAIATHKIERKNFKDTKKVIMLVIVMYLLHTQSLSSTSHMPSVRTSKCWLL